MRRFDIRDFIPFIFVVLTVWVFMYPTSFYYTFGGFIALAISIPVIEFIVYCIKELIFFIELLTPAYRQRKEQAEKDLCKRYGYDHTKFKHRNSWARQDKFKKYALFMFFIFVFIGCSPRHEQNEPTQVNNKFKGETIISYENTPRGISVQVIDDCQYIYCETASGVAIVHKANCNNSIHEK